MLSECCVMQGGKESETSAETAFKYAHPGEKEIYLNCTYFDILNVF